MHGDDCTAPARPRGTGRVLFDAVPSILCPQVGSGLLQVEGGHFPSIHFLP